MEEQQKQEIFVWLKEILEPFCVDQDIRTNNEKAYNVYGTTKADFNGKTIDGQYFASVMKMKNYVGFYFFPIYTHKDEFTKEDYPVLLKCLKGKSCFHIKKIDTELSKEISQILKSGANLYTSLGWR